MSGKCKARKSALRANTARSADGLTAHAIAREDIAIVPLEPRIMMDAVLDLDLDDYFAGQMTADKAGALTNLLDMAGNISEQFGSLSDRLTEELVAALGGASDLFAAADGNPYEQVGAGAFDEAFAAIRSLGSTLADSILSGISDDISAAMDTVLAQMKDEFRDAMGGYFSALTTEQRDSVYQLVDASLNQLGIEAIFSAETVFSEILTNAEDQAATLASDTTDFFNDAQRDAMVQQLRGAFIDTIAGQISTGVASIDTSINLANVVSGGNTILAFTQDAGSGVSATLDFGAVLADFSAVFESLGVSADTVTSWSDMLADMDEATFSFDISAQTSGSGANFVTDIVLDNFETDLLGFGGAIDAAYIEDFDFTAGMFSAGVTGIDLALFEIDFGGPITLSFSTTDFAVSLSTPGEDLLSLMITEAGGAGPVAYDSDAEYRFASIDFTAGLDWGLDEVFSDLDDGLPAAFQVDGQFALVGSAASLTVASNATVKAFDAEGDEITPSAENQARLDALTETVLGMARLDGSVLVDALTTAVSGLDVILSADLFDIDLPLIEGFDLSALTNVYQTISSLLLKPMDVDIGAIGLTKGTDTAVNGALLIDGIVADAQTGRVFSDQAGDTLTFTLNASAGGTDTAFTIELEVPDGGFESVAAYAQALKAAAAEIDASALGADKVLADFLIINAVRGDIELRSAGLSAFSLSGAPAVLALMGVASANDTARSGSPLSGNSLTGILDEGWMALFQLNLDIERTVTYTDDNGDTTTETVSYRTLTLSPEDGAWTLTGLVDQLNGFFDAAGIAMNAQANGEGGLDFVVDDAAAATAYAKDGSTVSDTSFRFEIAGAKASVASSVEVLQAYINETLGAVIPGAELDINIGTGQLVLRFPEIAFGVETAFEAGLAANLGPLAEIDMEAAFALAADFLLGFGIGVDLKGLYGADLDGEDGERDKVSDFIFLDDVNFTAEVSAIADEITGTGRLGIVEVEVGGSGVNQVAIGAKFTAGLIGQDAESGDYLTRVTFADLMDGANSAEGISSLIGTFDLVGTVDTDSGTAFALIAINDIRVGLSGVNIGIEDDAIESITASLGDVFAPTEWTLDIESPVIELIAGLGTDDFVDTLYNSLMLVDQLLKGLAGDMAFLGAEIPILGISVLDVMDFAKDMADQLRAFSSSPNEGLSDISASLASAFGLDADELILVWDGTDSVFYVSLALDFIDAPLEYDFSLDLAELLGSMAGSDSAIANVLSVASSLGNVTGDGRIVLDASLGFDLTFGVDLSSLVETVVPVTPVTALTAMSGINQLSQNTANSGHNGRDMLISVTRSGAEQPEYIDIKLELGEASTVGDAISLIHDGIAAAGHGGDIGIEIIGKNGLGEEVRFLIDGANKGLADFGIAGLEITSVGFVDTGAAPLDFDGAEALFGTDEPIDAEAEKVTGLDLSTIDTAAAYAFGLLVNGSGPFEISISADAGRDAAGLADAIQAALAATLVSRADIGLGLPSNLKLDKLVSASLSADGKLELTTTNFAQTIGKDPIAMTLTGAPTGQTSLVSVMDLGGSNIARALGFTLVDGDAMNGEFAVHGKVLEAHEENDSGISAFIVTDDITVNGRDLSGTGIRFEFLAGVPDGLNMALSLGPLSVSVVDGVAVIGDGEDGSAYVNFGIDDAVDAYLDNGDAADSRVYLSAVGDIFAGTTPNDAGLSDLFTFDAKAALELVLPLEDSLGLLEAVDDASISIRGDLFTADGSFSDATGALVALFGSGSVSDYLDVQITLPSFDEILENLNPWAIINDPILLTNGLDMILSALDSTLRSVIRAMDLPIVGDAMTQGLTVFNDIAYAILRPIQEAANTPNPDGSMPTTIDLIERVVNDALKSLFGTDQDVIRAVLTEDANNPSVVAEIFLDGFTIFEAALDVGFDLGIPGLNLEVGQNSALLFEIIADINIAFGIDKNGFFFLNDTDTAEIIIEALVRTSDDFVASASLGLVGMALTANKIENHGFGNDIKGAVIGGRIEIDLFTSLGSAIADGQFDEEVDGYGKDNGYENIVRLNELSTGKSASGEGSRMVSITGVFEVHVDLHLTTSVVNPATGEAITELPSAIADFVFDATYEIGGELEMERLEFQDVGLYAGDFLAENVMPVLDQIYGYVEPIADMVQFMKSTGIGDFTIYELIRSITQYTYPAALFVFDAIDTISGVMDFIEDLGDDATIYFGSFSLLAPASATGVIDTSNSKNMGNLRPGSGASQSSSLELTNDAISNKTAGINFDFLIFKDVSNVLNLITGNLEEVELFEIDLTLLDFTLNIDLVDAIRSAVSFLPGKVVDALFGGFQASFYIHAEAGITVGYDLYGIAQFLGSGDAIDILDGMYFDAERPLLGLEASFNVGIGVNLAIIKAGLGLEGYFSLEISMNDPNQDGKLRFGEMVWVIDNHSVLDLFEGEIKLGLEFYVYFELDLFFFSVGGEWDWTLIDLNERFGKDFMSNPHFLDTEGGVTTLNMGATAGSQVGGNAVDGNDTVEFNGDRVYINGRDAGTISGDTVLIYAGEGNNVIDVSGLSAGISFQIVTGDGDDTIVVGNASGIISTGSGNDSVLSAAGASVLNFAALGLAGFGAIGPAAAVAAPSATMPAGNAPTSFGAVRDRLPSTSDQELLIMSEGGGIIDMSGSTANLIIVATSLDIIGDDGGRTTLADWTAAKYQGGEPDMAEVREKIDRAMLTYTADGQTRATSLDTTIIAGTGNDIIIAGNGNDTIIDEGGDNIVLAGDGDDRTELKGSGNNWVEAGAGSDLVIGSEGNDTIMGWGRYDATTTAAEYAEALAHMSAAERADFAQLVRTLLSDDGNDWIEGNGGDDIIIGNGGNRNVLIGGNGDDVIVSGTGNDIMAGGDITIRTADGSVIDHQPGFNPIGQFVITAELGADGDDRLHGQAGNNVMIGGGGDDRLEGVAGRNVMIGDFAEITMSGSSTILSVNSLHIHAHQQGNDTILGGALADVAIGGGGQDAISAGIGRNVVIGDNALLTSTNMFEGVTSLVSLLGSQDDADQIWSGINTSIIVAGGSHQSYGDFISTGHFYGAPSTSAVQGVIVFADYGDLEGSLQVPSTLTTTFDAGDNDIVHTNAGNDIIFAGAGIDTVSSGDGNDIVFGDIGTYRLDRIGREIVTLSTEHNALANPEPGQTGTDRTLTGNDTITSGDGDNIIFGGLGDDTVVSGNGDNLVLGDNGRVLYGVAGAQLGRLWAQGLETDLGGRDDIATGSGRDVIMGGGDEDRIDAGAGNDITIGDWAVVDFVGRALTTQTPQYGGDDLIAGGDGNDIVVGGAGDDRLSGGGDANVLVGDFASLTWRGNFALETMMLDAIGHFGNDVIYSSNDPRFGSGRNADGNTIAIGGRGDDVLHGGAAKDLLMGDWAVFDFLSPAGRPGTSAFDRLISAESTQNWAFGHDRLYGNGDRDIMIAGDGNDLLMGGDGQDLIAADAAIYVNYHDGWELLETRYPFDGGDDVIDGGRGRDVVISGFFNFGDPGAGDFLYGDTIEDFMMGTSGSVLMFMGNVIRFNYLGLETKELISDNQLGASAGVLMRPIALEPEMLAAIPAASQPSERAYTLSMFDPEDEIARQDTPLVLQFDTVMREIMLGDDMVQLLHAYRQGNISVDDLEDAIREAVLAMLADRYGDNVPSRLMEMLERYIELLLSQLDPQGEVSLAGETPVQGAPSSPPPSGG